MTATEATPEQLVRAIRREEAYAAQMRARSAGRRAALLERLSRAAGSMSEAARMLGVTPQAVSKSVAAARQETELGETRTDASVSAMDVRLAGTHHHVGWAADVVTDSEWAEIEDPEAKREAAARAAEAWRLRITYTGAIARFLHNLALGCGDVAEDEEAQTPQQVWDTALGEVGESVPADLLPNTREQARELATFAEALSVGLGWASRHSTYRRWAERAGDVQD